ncbi:MAG: ATP-binding protein [Bacteroidia bacterium]|nr:ATP-binding protein [Bacteroidia bacterium]
MKILIIENKPAVAEIVSSFIVEAGPDHSEITHSANVDAGIIEIKKNNSSDKEHSFDVILLDLDNCNNGEPEPLVNLLANCSDLPVIVLLNEHNRELINKAVKKGAQDFLIKTALDKKTISAILQNAIERQKILNEERQKNNETTNFLYRASHDLKGPVITLNGLVFFAQKKVTDSDALEYLDKIGISAKKLEVLIASLLELTISRKGNTKTEQFKFQSVLDEVLSAFTINKSEILIHTDLKTEYIKADRTMLFYTLKNLIENAIKYRRKNVRTEIVVSFSESGSGYEISVKDNGQGIERQYLDKVFDMFYRANETASGSGLGLYNAKVFITKMAGDIKIESTSGLHTTVKIFLPKILQS